MKGVNMLKSWKMVKGKRCTVLVTTMKANEPLKHQTVKGMTNSLFTSLIGFFPQKKAKIIEASKALPVLRKLNSTTLTLWFCYNSLKIAYMAT